MTAFLLLLKRVPSWAWIGLALIAAGWVYGHTRYNAGQADVQAKWDASVEKGKAEIARLQAQANRISTKIETKYLTRVETIRGATQTIVRQVPVFVPAGSCELPGGFRVLHDAAAQGSVPDAARIPDAAPVPAQAVAGTVADNYGTCHETGERLIELQDWVREQKAANP